MMLRLKVAPAIFLFLSSVAAHGQSFDLGGGNSAAKTQKQPQAQQGMGFGNSIGVARLARGADDALKHGNYAQAATYAKQATDAAPQNAQLWFLYGYAARLANKLGESEQAYNRGLRISPSAPEGQSGLAQTYEKMGRIADAKRLLLQVVNAHPERVNDLLIAGELFMRTNDLQQGLAILQRAEARQPSSHAELLMAIAYMKLNEPQRAKQLLDMARKRDPRNTDIFRAVATFQREQKDYKGAIATLRAAPGQKPDVLADLGYTYELAGDKKNSALTWERAAAADPSNIGYQLSAASSELRLDDIAKANQYVQRAQAINPDYYRLHALKAQIARLERRDDDAIREYQLAIAKLPESVPEGVLYPVQLRLNLAELLKSNGHPTEAQQQIALAEQEVDKLQIEGPARAEFLRVRASIRGSSDNPADLKGAEQDLTEAMRLDPNNPLIEMQFANLLWREGRKPEAQKLYQTVLQQDPKNRFALESIGYLMRDNGDSAAAQRYFEQLAADYPDDYIAYLALGDLFTAEHDYNKALAEYEQGYARNKQNAAIVANAANAALELHKLPEAKVWLSRATAEMQSDPRVMVERERYLFYQGDYLQSAKLGYAALKSLPKNRDASVYLSYDLYNMGHRDDVLALASKYESIIPYEPNFPLLEGHVHRQGGLLEQAVDDYTHAIQRDPNMVEAYVNRGYVYNDLQNAESALADFDHALKLQPNNGIAQLGRSFSDLELRRSAAALASAQQARQLMGDSGAVELALATAYSQLRRTQLAETHYRAAIQYAPNDIGLWLALADTLYNGHHYQASIDALQHAVSLDPHNPLVYAEQAHAYAELKQRANAMRAIQAADREGGNQAAVLLATGDALLILGDRNAAMQRFGRALNASDANRVDVRLALAKLFTDEGHFGDARQQIAMGFADARIGESAPASADDLIEAGNLFLAMHDFDLAGKFYNRAQQAGAPDQAVALGRANTYLAQGSTRRAESALAQLGSPLEYRDDYDYQLALGTLYRQENDSARALTAFGRAFAVETDPSNYATEDTMLQVAGDRGVNVTRKFSVLEDVSAAPIFEDTTIYALDAQLLSNGKTNLPPPRSSYETRNTTGFRYEPGDGLPKITGFFQERNAFGQISFPAENKIISRNTFDTTVNGGISPSLRIGDQRFDFNTGVQFTLRRDKTDPVDINENLFRQFVFMNSTPLFDWISIRGDAFHESGPFTAQSLSSRELGAKVEFQVGRPWGNTSLITGYTIDDFQISPLIREYFTTSSYGGLQHKFGKRVTASALAEYIRSWRVQDLSYAKAQALAPGGNVDARINERWALNAFGTYQRNKTISAYDNVQSGIFISYTRPLRQTVNDGQGAVNVSYPIRLSFGVQEESFFNFTGAKSTVVRPVIRLTLF